MRTRRQQGHGGFTLIELLVVIVILGVIAGVVVFAVGGVRDKGSTSANAADAQTLRTAQETYFANAKTGAYAPNDAALVSAGLLASAPTLHHTKGYTDENGKPRFAITCDPAVPTCGSDGATPDANFNGTAPLGTWTRVGDLPTGSVVNSNLQSTMVTMANGKVLLIGKPSSVSPPTVALASQGYLPGPVAVYNPATAKWSLVSGPIGSPNPFPIPVPANFPNNPNYLPVFAVQAVSLVGGAAECNTNCGKVLVMMQLGQASSARSIAPDYQNQLFYLFDPAAFDAGSNPWTRVPDPPASGVIGNQGVSIVRLGNCTRAGSPDCGKVMVIGGYNSNDPTDATANGSFDRAGYRTSLWDPSVALSAASWSVTAGVGRLVTATTTAGNAIVTSPDANFTASDVGKVLGSAPGMGTGVYIQSWQSATQVTATVTCTAGCGTTTVAAPARVGLQNPSEVQLLKDGRVLTTTGGGSAPTQSMVYDPVTPRWTVNVNRPSDFTYTCPGSATAMIHSPVAGSVVMGDGRVLSAASIRGSQSGGSGSCVVVGSGTPPENSVVFNPGNPAAPWSVALGVCPCPQQRTPSLVTLPPAFGSKVFMAFAMGSNPKRTVTASTTSGSVTLTATAGTFASSDLGRAVVGPGIPGGAVIQTVPAGGATATLSSGGNATATASGVTLTIGNGWATSALYDGTTWTSIDPSSAPTPRYTDSAGLPMANTGTGANSGIPAKVPIAMLPSGQVLMAGGNKCILAGTACIGTTVQNGAVDTWLYTPPVP